MALTSTQRRLRAEIEEIASVINLDHWNIEEYKAERRTTQLKLMKDQLIRSEIIIKYTLIDELLNDIICDYYFRHGKKKKQTYRDLWRTKKFSIFVHHILDETFLLKKLNIIDAIKTVPREVRSAVYRINDVGNDLAHSFFPENRRRYAAQKKVLYNGIDLFTKEGVAKFEEDAEIVNDYLLRRWLGYG
jgi:hypothetical protein